MRSHTFFTKTEDDMASLLELTATEVWPRPPDFIMTATPPSQEQIEDMLNIFQREKNDTVQATPSSLGQRDI